MWHVGQYIGLTRFIVPCICLVPRRANYASCIWLVNYVFVIIVFRHGGFVTAFMASVPFVPDRRQGPYSAATNELPDSLPIYLQTLNCSIKTYSGLKYTCFCGQWSGLKLSPQRGSVLPDTPHPLPTPRFHSYSFPPVWFRLFLPLLPQFLLFAKLSVHMYVWPKIASRRFRRDFVCHWSDLETQR